MTNYIQKKMIFYLIISASLYYKDTYALDVMHHQREEVFTSFKRSFEEVASSIEKLNLHKMDDRIKISYDVSIDIDESGSKIEIEDIKKLSDSHLKIKRLNLSETFLDNTGLEAVSSIRSIEELIIADNRFNDDGMLYLKDLKKIKEINIVGNKITENGIKNLVHLPLLENLDAGCTYLGNDGIKTLSSIKSLKYLDIRACGFDDEALSNLESIPNLIYLNISNNKISEYELRKFTENISRSNKKIKIIANELIN